MNVLADLILVGSKGSYSIKLNYIEAQRKKNKQPHAVWRAEAIEEEGGFCS